VIANIRKTQIFRNFIIFLQILTVFLNLGIIEMFYALHIPCADPSTTNVPIHWEYP